MREHKGSMREKRGSMREPKASGGTKRALAREQSGETLVSSKSRVALSSGELYIYIYIDIIHPELGL